MSIWIQYQIKMKYIYYLVEVIILLLYYLMFFTFGHNLDLSIVLLYLLFFGRILLMSVILFLHKKIGHSKDNFYAYFNLTYIVGLLILIMVTFSTK